MKENNKNYSIFKDECIKSKDWHGWTPENDMTVLEYFINENISSRCTGTCKKCGFYLLNTDGNLLINPDDSLNENDEPLCGIN